MRFHLVFLLHKWPQNNDHLSATATFLSLLGGRCSQVWLYTQSFLVIQKRKIRKTSKSQSYQNLMSSFFWFLLLSLSVCSIIKYCLCFKMAKLNSEKRKKSLFYEEKSLVGLTLVPFPENFDLCNYICSNSNSSYFASMHMWHVGPPLKLVLWSEFTCCSGLVSRTENPRYRPPSLSCHVKLSNSQSSLYH